MALPDTHHPHPTTPTHRSNWRLDSEQQLLLLTGWRLAFGWMDLEQTNGTERASRSTHVPHAQPAPEPLGHIGRVPTQNFLCRALDRLMMQGPEGATWAAGRWDPRLAVVLGLLRPAARIRMMCRHRAWCCPLYSLTAPPHAHVHPLPSTQIPSPRQRIASAFCPLTDGRLGSGLENWTTPAASPLSPSSSKVS